MSARWFKATDWRITLAAGAATCSLALLAGCAQPQLDAVQRQRWAIAWLGALNSQRWEQVGPLLAPQAVYTDPLASGVMSPLLMGMYLHSFWWSNPQLELTPRRVDGDASVVVVEWTASGVAGAPPDGLQGVFILEVSGHALTRVHGYFNPAGLHRRFGFTG